MKNIFAQKIGLLLTIAAIALWVPSFVHGQTETQPSQHPAAQAPVVSVLPSKTIWKFGIQLSGSGNTRNAQVTFPLPVEWDNEQAIDVINIDASDNVNGAKIKKLPNNASQMFFKVPRLTSGETAHVFVTIEIAKMASEVPEDTSVFVFGKARGRALRSYLTPSPFIESSDKRIKELAEALPIDESAPAWDQVETIYDWVRENIQYEFDTQIKSCLWALDNGKGDCEELSSMFIALCRARGIPARAVWIPDHTYPEFYLEDADGNGHWFPCQAAGSYAFGHMPEIKPILQKGDKFKVKNFPEPQRYIQPTLKAVGAAPAWQWHMTQVEDQPSQSEGSNDR